MIIWLQFTSGGNEASMFAPWREILTVQSYRRPTQMAKTWNCKWNASATFVSNSNKHFINRLNTMRKGATFQAPTGCQWQTLETSCYGSKFRKNVDYWKKNTVYIRTLHPHWEKPFRHWKKNWESVLCTFLQLTYFFCTTFARFRHINMDFTWHLKIFTTFWPWIYEFCLQLKTLICITMG